MRAMTERARLLRASSTPSERIPWEALRGRRPAGTKWRRQQKLGRFVVDFFCAESALAWGVRDAATGRRSPAPNFDEEPKFSGPSRRRDVP